MTTLDETRIAAYLRGALDPSEHALVEAELDRQPEWLAVVAVMAREPRAGGLEPSTGSGSDAGDEVLDTGRISLAPGTRVGRFEVLSRIAAGGMGVVHEAWDATLERRVALKLILRRPRDARARERQLREARTLAQLSAPNVVSVFDAGEHEGRIYVAMEKLEGPNLRVHLRSRAFTVTEIVALFIEAARGLDAAHRKGIVHRDFKPDNVIVEGVRVVVVDFGLALPSASEPLTFDGGAGVGGAGASGSSHEPTQTDTVAGTPAYMAPEQRRGDVVTARSDQYSLCVALAEALDDAELHVSRRLGAVIERGRAEDPLRRFSDLGHLISGLERAVGPSRRLRRSLWAGALTTVALTAGIGASWVSERVRGTAEAVEPCSAAREELGETWNPDVREHLDQGLRSFDKPYLDTLAERVLEAVDTRASAWSELRHEVCMDHERGLSSDDGHDLQVACLERRRVELELFLQLDWRAGDEASAAQGLRALAELRDVEGCREVSELRAGVPMPEEPEARAHVEVLRRGLAEVELLHRARRMEEAEARARELLVEARALGHAPTRAELQSELGWILVTAGEHEQAEAELDAALHLAEACGHDELIAQLWVREMWLVGHILARSEQGRAAAAHGEAWLQRLDEPTDLSFDYYAHLGWLELTAGEAARSVEAFTLALERADEAFTLALAHNGLGAAQLSASEPQVAAEHLRQATEGLAQLLGEQHPEVAKTRNNAAAVRRILGEYDEAARLFALNVTAFTEAYGPTHELVAQTELNLAVLALDRGEYQAGLDYAESAALKLESSFGEDHLNTLQARGSQADALIRLERYDEGFALMREVIAAQERSLGLDHPRLAATHHNLGVGLSNVGRTAEAIIEYARALDLLERRKGPEHHELAPVLVNLGLAHEELGQLHTAQTMYARALGLAAPHDEPEAHSRLGRLLVTRGELELGRVQLELALTQYRALEGESLFVAQTAFALARALGDGDVREQERAVDLAREAQAFYTRGGDEQGATEAQAWLEAHALEPG